MADDWHSWQGVARVRAECENQAVDEGLSGLPLFFRSQELFTARLDATPSYKQRQQKWADDQARKNPPVKSRMQEALEAIRDGHNDPRALASQVLNDI